MKPDDDIWATGETRAPPPSSAPERRLRGPMEPVWLDRFENWVPIEGMLQSLCERMSGHGLTVEDLKENIRTGRIRLWMLERLEDGGWKASAVFGTRIYTQPNGRLVCSLSWAAGEDALHPDVVIPAVEAYAQEHDCFAVEVMGRRGWSRVLRDHGYGEHFVGLLREF